MGQTFMTLYYRRRSLGQRLVDAIGVGIAFAIFYIPAVLLDRQERKAANR
jgi:hypothetical protein